MKKIIWIMGSILFLSSCVGEFFPEGCEKTMQKIEESPYYKCNGSIYYQYKKQIFQQEKITYSETGIKEEDFQILGENLGTDGRYLFEGEYKGSKFDIHSYENRDLFAIDKDYLYLGNKKIFKIDRLTFESFENPKATFAFAKDKNHVFLIAGKYTRILKGIDAKTFQYIGGQSFKDKKGLYEIFGFISSEYEKIGGNFDLESIKHVKGDYYKDKNNIYKFNFENNKLEITSEKFNFESFGTELKHIGGKYYKDDGNIYYRENHGDILVEVDYNSFEYILGDLAKDKNGLFEKNNIIKPGEVKELIPGKYYEIRSQNNLYIAFLEEENIRDIYEQDLGNKIIIHFLDFGIYGYEKEKIEVVGNNLRIGHLDIRNGQIFLGNNWVFGGYFFKKDEKTLHCLDNFYENIIDLKGKSDEKYISTRISGKYFWSFDLGTFYNCKKIHEQVLEIDGKYAWLKDFKKPNDKKIFYDGKFLTEDSPKIILKNNFGETQYILLSKNRDLLKDGIIHKGPFYLTTENELNFDKNFKGFIIGQNNVYDKDFNLILENVGEIKYLYNHSENPHKKTKNNFFIDNNGNIYDKNFEKLTKEELKKLTKEEKEEIKRLRNK